MKVVLSRSLWEMEEAKVEISLENIDRLGLALESRSSRRRSVRGLSYTSREVGVTLFGFSKL